MIKIALDTYYKNLEKETQDSITVMRLTMLEQLVVDLVFELEQLEQRLEQSIKK